jgi:hypothetical protein
VIEMSQTKWLVAALVPGVERQPLKKFDADEETLLKLLHRWRREAGQGQHELPATPSALVVPLTKPVRKRSEAHLAFVASQPCLICKTSPCDAHHLKIAQPRSLGRKVSDEFTVPLCRKHHRELHKHGNEATWWANLQVTPIPIAKELWEASPVHGPPNNMQGQDSRALTDTGPRGSSAATGGSAAG